MWLTDQAPARIAAPISASTMKRLRAEKEMILSIIRQLSVLVRRRTGRRRLGFLLRRSRRFRGRCLRRAMFVTHRSAHAPESSLQPRLGVDQEVRLSDDRVSGRDPLPNLVVPIHLRAGLDLARLEPPIALRHENEGARASREDGAVGHRHDAAERTLE